MLRSPFLLPLGLHACHLDDWELFDCDRAGCVVCGAVHACDPLVCPLVDHEGRQVCEITGLCVKDKVFAEHEFVDTTCVSATAAADPPLSSSSRAGGEEFHRPRPPPCAAHPLATVDAHQVRSWVTDILCSSKTDAALRCEELKRTARLQALFTRLVRQAKLRGAPLNLVDVCAAMAHATQQIRLPGRAQHPREQYALACRCSDEIVQFLRRFAALTRVLMPSTKVHGFVVGVLYMMRTGVRAWDSVEILPHAPELRTLLPLENQLQKRFDLSTKIITEAENSIKSTLRSAARADLVRAGFAEY